MIRFASKVFGVTIFALALIWSASPGDARQNDYPSTKTLWDYSYAQAGDSVHINLQNEPEGSAPRKENNIFRSVKNLSRTAFKIRNQYMEEVDMDEIIAAGIRGMLTDLDRYSVLMEKKSYDALMESTRGNYQGLGLQIDSRDDYITIIAPIEGTPAYRKGLRAGDVIWEIEGQTTLEMKSSDAANLMRGEAGTSINLTIKRQGIDDLLDFEVERAVITLKSVNYFGVIPETNIGYVRLSRFAQETSHELREAITALNKEGIEGLVFDLRSNGGGLLDQAIETAELFLNEGSEIVYTKGRYAESERHFTSARPPIFGPEKPLVILVDQGTASASEIVAGAIQDWDRGFIIGSTTYGKGLVQEVFRLTNDGSMALKLTTAKYYVPSGRCIQRPERQGKNKPGDRAPVADADSDSVTINDREVFYTNGGRVVYGGGGIVPDMEIERELWQPIEINLERQSMFFDFAIKFVSEHPETKPGFEVTEEIVAQFREFTQEKDFEYKTSMQVALESLEEKAAGEDRAEAYEEAIASLREIIENDKQTDFEKSRQYVERSIKREIVRAIAGERGVYEQSILKSDKLIKKAVEVLTSPQDYARLMTESHPEKSDI